MASEEAVAKATEVMQKAVSVVASGNNGEKVTAEDRQEMREENAQTNAEFQKTQAEKVAEIKAGITNEAAKAHVAKLTKEITNLRKENIKKDFAIKMLQKNGDVLAQEMQQELSEMKSYLTGVSGVFETFVERINNKLSKREAGLNESRGNTEGTEQSN